MFRSSTDCKGVGFEDDIPSGARQKVKRGTTLLPRQPNVSSSKWRGRRWVDFTRSCGATRLPILKLEVGRNDMKDSLTKAGFFLSLSIMYNFINHDNVHHDRPILLEPIGAKDPIHAVEGSYTLLQESTRDYVQGVMRPLQQFCQVRHLSSWRC